MEKGINTAGLLLGLGIGFPAGIAFQYMRRAWADYTKTKANVPVLRADAWRSGLRAAGWFAIMAVIVLGMLNWAGR